MERACLDLRKGYLVRHEGRICSVYHWNILRNDRRLFVQIKFKDLLTGRISELKEHGDTKYEVLDNEQKDLSYSYRDGQEDVFYTEEGEEVRCPTAAAADALVWQCDTYPGFFVEGKLVTISLPSSVVGVVKDTAPPLRGQGSGLKDAMLENDIKVKVSNLTAVGDKVRLDSETLEFKERVT